MSTTVTTSTPNTTNQATITAQWPSPLKPGQIGLLFYNDPKEGLVLWVQAVDEDHYKTIAAIPAGKPAFVVPQGFQLNKARMPYIFPFDTGSVMAIRKALTGHNAAYFPLEEISKRLFTASTIIIESSKKWHDPETFVPEVLCTPAMWEHQNRAFFHVQSIFKAEKTLYEFMQSKGHVTYKPNTAALLWMGMRTGKTKVAIEIIKWLHQEGLAHRVLITVKKRIALEWEKNIAAHAADENFHVINLCDAKLSTKKAQELITEAKFVCDEAGQLLIVIANYEMCWRSGSISAKGDYAKGWGPSYEENILIDNGYIIENLRPDAVILDEVHNLKTHNGRASKYFDLLRSSNNAYYLYLTGTPAAQNPLDVFALGRLLRPGLFSRSIIRFEGYYVQKGGYQNTQVVGVKHREELRYLTGIDAFRCDSSVLRLPKKIEQNVNAPLSEKETSAYITLKENIITFIEASESQIDSLTEQIELWKSVKYPTLQTPEEFEAYAAELEEMTTELELYRGYMKAPNKLALVMRLRQLCAGYGRLNNSGKLVQINDPFPGKVTALTELISDMTDATLDVQPQIVVFYNFTHSLDLISKAFKENGTTYSVISGKLDQRQDWLQGRTRVLLAQISSAAEGLNLSQAETAIFYEADYKLSKMLQAEMRIFADTENAENTSRTVIYLTATYEDRNGATMKTADHTVIEKVAARKQVNSDTFLESGSYTQDLVDQILKDLRESSTVKVSEKDRKRIIENLAKEFVNHTDDLD